MMTALRWRRRYKLRLQGSTLRCCSMGAALAVAPDGWAAALAANVSKEMHNYSVCMRVCANKRFLRKLSRCLLAALKDTSKQGTRLDARLAHSGGP